MLKVLLRSGSNEYTYISTEVKTDTAQDKRCTQEKIFLLNLVKAYSAVLLTFSIYCVKISADNILKYFFLFFSEKKKQKNLR